MWKKFSPSKWHGLEIFIAGNQAGFFYTYIFIAIKIISFNEIPLGKQVHSQCETY